MASMRGASRITQQDTKSVDHLLQLPSGVAMAWPGPPERSPDGGMVLAISLGESEAPAGGEDEALTEQRHTGGTAPACPGTLVRHWCGNAVRKVYDGPDADERAAAEYRALTALAGVFPVPPLIASEPGVLVMGFVEGAHGQDLIDLGHARSVL